MELRGKTRLDRDRALRLHFLKGFLEQQQRLHLKLPNLRKSRQVQLQIPVHPVTTSIKFLSPREISKRIYSSIEYSLPVGEASPPT